MRCLLNFQLRFPVTMLHAVFLDCWILLYMDTSQTIILCFLLNGTGCVRDMYKMPIIIFNEIAKLFRL